MSPQKTSSPPVSKSSPISTQAQTPSYSDPGIIPPGIQEDHWDHALSFFFTTYARPFNYKNESRGFLEYVEPLYKLAAPQSTLHYSTLALATFFLGAWTNHSLDSQISRLCYANAISSMKEQLVSSDDCSNDEMLLSILLLQLYEVFQSFLNEGISY